MNRLLIQTTIIVGTLSICIHGFSPSLPVGNAIVQSQGTSLFGILDDLLEEENNTADIVENSTDDDNINDQKMMDLYHSLIFSNDLQNVISNRLEACSDPNFLEYLTASSKSAQDADEKQGLLDLISQIDEVQTQLELRAAAEKEAAAAAAMAEKEAELEAKATPTDPTEEEESKKLTNADLLRKASKIDAAMVAASDDEKPSDFMSDCREVANLSRGFNDSGQMRVGGR